MKSQLAIKLQTILNGMSQKTFDEIWNKVIKDKKNSPTFEDVKKVIIKPKPPINK